MSEIFISYARSTAAKAQQIAEALRGLGYGVWRDDELPAHRSYAEVIQERLSAAKAVVVVWSAEAVRSEWVQSEADRARTERKLVQLSVDGAPLPMPFDRIQCADLSGWSGDLAAAGWKKVADSIADMLRGVAPEPAVSEAKAAPTHRASICVLPFANMSGDAEQEYFSDGISEDIITDLSKVSALSVISRNGAFRYKGQQVDIPQVARDLNVSHVLEGSVRKAGNRVRITAQLIDGAANDHVWAERYDRNLDDIFALQDEISEAIVTALKLKLLPQEKKAIERRGTESAEAYDLYLAARSYYLTGANGDPRTHEAVERLSRRAVEIDSGYAQAWGLMAFGQFNLHNSFGRANDGGRAALDRALSLNPDLAEARAVKARLLSDEGRLDEAAAEIAIALRLDPESYEVNFRAGFQSYLQGRLAEAARHFEKAAALLETDTRTPFMLISCYTALGDAENTRRAAGVALARAEKIVAADRSNSDAMAKGAAALAALGESDRARDWMRRALLIDPDNLQMRYNFACSLASLLGDPEAALDMLGPVLERDAGGLVRQAPTDPDLAGLRDDPRFQAMIAAAEARLAAAKPADGTTASEPA
ncbi:MAG TPA: TIR domain-containing protein [Caulobacteraceae bacterium]|nr:TIR domain-containing protein [Caulobacteraceae bacterium]